MQIISCRQFCYLLNDTELEPCSPPCCNQRSQNFLLPSLSLSSSLSVYFVMSLHPCLALLRSRPTSRLGLVIIAHWMAIPSPCSAAFLAIKSRAFGSETRTSGGSASATSELARSSPVPSRARCDGLGIEPPPHAGKPAAAIMQKGVHGHFASKFVYNMPSKSGHITTTAV